MKKYIFSSVLRSLLSIFLGDNIDYNYLYDGSSKIDFQAGYQL